MGSTDPEQAVSTPIIPLKLVRASSTLNLTGASNPEGVAVCPCVGVGASEGDLEVYQAAAAAARAAEATAVAPYLDLRNGVRSLMLARLAGLGGRHAEFKSVSAL